MKHYKDESELRSSDELDYLIRELIESELDYVNDLKLCRTAHIVPLSKSFDVTCIFICWNQLINSHESKLDRISRSSLRDKRVILGSFLDLLNSCTNLYINFCSRQTESTKNFETKLLSDMRFRQLVNECQRNLHRTIESYSDSDSSTMACRSTLGKWYRRALGNAKLSLTNFILKPMQRITKYSLLFTKIVEMISSKSSEEQLIDLAMEVKAAALKLCEQVNDACRRKEDTELNKRRLAWAQSHIKQSLNHDSSLDLTAFAAANDEQQMYLDCKYPETIVFDSETNCLGQRHFIKAGCLSKLRSGRELVLFLFNDILLVTHVRGGSILKAEDIFRSAKAQQTYYKFYRAPILLEHLQLVTVSKNRRASWVEKQSITMSFSDLLSGNLYELLALNPAEKTLWIEELNRASEEARNARAILEERNSLRSSKRLGITDWRGRLFVTVLEAKMTVLVGRETSTGAFADSSSLNLSGTNNSFRKLTSNNPTSALVSVQIQLRKKDTFDLLGARTENVPTSDAFKTNPRVFGQSPKFAQSIEEPRSADYVIEFEDECTQFLLPHNVTTDDGVDILDLVLMEVSSFSPNHVVARRRVRLDKLIESHDSRGLMQQQQQHQDFLKSDRPSDMVFKLKSVDGSACERLTAARTKSSLESSGINIPSAYQSARLENFQQEDLCCFEIKLRFHLQLFCDDDKNDDIL